MRLNTIFDTNRQKKSKRVGRGIGSGKGKTCGAGHKGQSARTGVAIKGFEGGQMPIIRRLPKRGFNNPNKIYNKVVNLDQIDKLVTSGKLKNNLIDKKALKEVGLISNLSKPVKLLAKGKITHKINVVIDSFSPSALKEIEALGGTIKLSEEGDLASNSVSNS